MIVPLVIGGLGIVGFGVWETVVLPRHFSSLRPLIPNRVRNYKNLVPVLALTALYYATFFSFQPNGAQFVVRVQGVSAISQ